MKRTALLIMVLVAVPQAVQGSILPRLDKVIDGVAVSDQGAFGDDFVTYSADLLGQLQNLYPSELSIAEYGDFNSPSFKNGGVGGQDLIIYTQAGGQSNGANLDTPFDAVTGSTSTFRGTWGNGNHASTNGQVVTVADVLSFLPTGSYIPVFVYDNNETMNGGDVFIRGKVEILDKDTMAVNGSWAFDNVKNGIFDDSDLNSVLAQGEFNVNSISNGQLTVDANTGSGEIDYLGYAPTMDLRNFDADDIFTVTLDLRGLDNGGEELFISGSFGIEPVPEPATLAIWSLLGVGGLGLVARRRKKLKQ